MTTPDPMGYVAKPDAMGRLVSRVFEEHLFEHGVPFARVGLMAVYVEPRVATELAGRERCPADKALGDALGVVAKAWDEAMTVHGMFRRSIDDCQREVRLEIEELVDEHVNLVRAARNSGQPAPNPRRGAEQASPEQDGRMDPVMRTSGAGVIPPPARTW